MKAEAIQRLPCHQLPQSPSGHLGDVVSGPDAGNATREGDGLVGDMENGIGGVR